MDYKSLMGYSNKKTKKVEEKLPKKNLVIENVKNEIKDYPLEQMLTEVGASVQYKKYVKLIDKDFDSLVNNVRELKNLLMKTGARREATELQNVFAKNVGQFRKFMKVKFLRMIDKLI